jgi:hypothetical protein
MLDRAVADVMRAGQASTEPRLLALGYGQIGARDAARIFAATLTNVILPGFETVGVDLSATSAHLRARGWLTID